MNCSWIFEIDGCLYPMSAGSSQAGTCLVSNACSSAGRCRRKRRCTTPPLYIKTILTMLQFDYSSFQMRFFRSPSIFNQWEFRLEILQTRAAPERFTMWTSRFATLHCRVEASSRRFIANHSSGINESHFYTSFSLFHQKIPIWFHWPLESWLWTREIIRNLTKNENRIKTE